jgi:hypothetical protein
MPKHEDTNELPCAIEVYCKFIFVFCERSIEERSIKDVFQSILPKLMCRDLSAGSTPPSVLKLALNIPPAICLPKSYNVLASSMSSNCASQRLSNFSNFGFFHQFEIPLEFCHLLSFNKPAPADVLSLLNKTKISISITKKKSRLQ